MVACPFVFLNKGNHRSFSQCFVKREISIHGNRSAEVDKVQKHEEDRLRFLA